MELERDNQIDPLVETVLACQEAYSQWRGESDGQGRAEYAAALEQLWALLEEDLVRVARGWARSNLMSSNLGRNDAIRSLAMAAFLPIIEALPQLRIDPSRNVRAYVTTIARRGLLHEYRKTRDTPTLRSGPQYESAGSAMAIEASKELEDIVDPEQDFEERLVNRIDDQERLAAIRKIWDKILSGIDAQIVALRWAHDPPMPYAEVAARLGAGWTSAAVRKRHQRIMDRTHAALTREAEIAAIERAA